MRIPTFTFKNEAIWITALSVAPLAFGLLVLMIVRLFK
jgi:hypothetical protein